MSKKGIDDLKKEYEEIHMSDEQINDFKKSIEQAKRDNRRKNPLRVFRIAGTAVAAALIAFIILPNTSASVAHAMESIPFLGNAVRVVTFRDYQYESENQIADIDVPMLEIAEATDGEEAYDGGTAGENVAFMTLEESTDKINEDVEELTNRILKDFEDSIRDEDGAKEVIVSHETVPTTERYFTLKLTHYEGMADGAETVYYYTIDLITGERLQLSDLFAEDADYIGVISEEIMIQMREQMNADENRVYWLDEEIEDWNFKGITEDTQFYINENNHLIICFSEGDVAPMYMGTVSFEIPDETLKDIRK